MKIKWTLATRKGDLFETAIDCDKYILFGRVWVSIIQKRGQCCCSLRKISEEKRLNKRLFFQYMNSMKNAKKLIKRAILKYSSKVGELSLR